MSPLRAWLMAVPLAAAAVVTTGCKEPLGEPCRCGDDCRSNACARGTTVVRGGACFNFQEVGECVRSNADNLSGGQEVDPYCPMDMGDTGFDDAGDAGVDEDDGGVNPIDLPAFPGIRCDVGTGAAP